MARFHNLSHVGQVLVEVIETAVTPGTEVVLAPPLEDPTSMPASVRITLLWITPQPGHRSDEAETNPDGTLAPPVPTLSAWYAVSTCGATDDQNAIGAHDLLGQIVRVFHARTTLELPIGGMGDGRIHVVQVPLDADLTEKVWTPMQVRQRPWVLFDVGPVQLIRTEPPGAPAPLVRPGGIRLPPVDAADRPHIERITPSVIGVGGSIRIDATYPGSPTRVQITTVRIVPPEIVPLSPDGPVRATLPASLRPGEYDVTLRGSVGAPSEPQSLTIVPAALPSLDAPAVLQHSRAIDLVLTGRVLGAGNVTLLFWPDGDIISPSDVHPVIGVAAGGTITIAAANLSTLANRQYRIALQHGPHLYTSYVLLEMTA